MKKQKKFLIQIIVFLTILLSSCKVFATDILSSIGEIKVSEDYLKYLELSDEEKKKVMAPRMYDIPKSKITTTNPLRLTRMLGSTVDSDYSLREIIPENMVIKNQQQTNSCWTFSSLATLESNLALKDYKKGITPIVYDFSERHMEYATSKTFKDGVINQNGFNREVGSGGGRFLSMPYLTNGTGAINEKDMKFENNEDSIYISEIQNKNVTTQVNDAIEFPAYLSSDDKTQIKQQMKEHIKNYGGIDACIHGASLSPNSKVYNNETGAIYCNNISMYPRNHAVTIIGWDDNYSTENFVESNRPQNNGAWIIKNSWGTGASYTLPEMKNLMFELFPDEWIKMGWTDATKIPDDAAKEFFVNNGYTIDSNNVATRKVGDDGFMYVSYEDVNIYLQLSGIIDAQNEKTYENIYQYNPYGKVLSLNFGLPKIYLATVFDKKTDKTEYLTQVSISASETYTCKVYVNPNGTSKAMSDLQQVQLKSGETETFEAGYHTIEFKEPLKINSDNFVVVLEIQGTNASSISLMTEFNYSEFFGENDGSIGYVYNNVKVESGKCFIASEDEKNANQWEDASKMYTATGGKVPNFDTTIKAFTTSKVLENIQVTNPPIKTEYIKNENFNAEGMVVKANYADGTSNEITDYTITDGSNLSVGQTCVTIAYNGKTTTQNITVVENALENITIKTPPNKLEYFAGEDFNKNGMVVEATYRDGSTKKITDYIVEDGSNLKNGQTAVTIKYEGKEVAQKITVKPNSVEKIEIKQVPDKLEYVVGQNFDATGMIVEATYESGMVKQVEDYTVQNGTNLQEDQESVTIEYEGKTAEQGIVVIVKIVTRISIKTNPTKMEYIQNKEELDLTGGVIEVLYNDNTTEDVPMTSDEITVSGFDNKEVGTKSIVLTYKSKTIQFDVEIKGEAKPENSNFDNMKGNITRVRAYYFTDANKKEYTIIDIELGNIIKAEQNDNMEYYYYLSTNAEETNITDWIKLDEAQISGDKLSFEINTSELSNYEELVSADEIYVYVKESATRNNMKSEKIVVAPSELFGAENIMIEEYVDGVKKDEVDPGEIINPTPGEKNDSTTAPGEIPKAGKGALILGFMIVILVIGRIVYVKYKDIQIK